MDTGNQNQHSSVGFESETVIAADPLIFYPLTQVDIEPRRHFTLQLAPDNSSPSCILYALTSQAPWTPSAVYKMP